MEINTSWARFLVFKFLQRSLRIQNCYTSFIKRLNENSNETNFNTEKNGSTQFMCLASLQVSRPTDLLQNNYSNLFYLVMDQTELIASRSDRALEGSYFYYY